MKTPANSSASRDGRRGSAKVSKIALVNGSRPKRTAERKGGSKIDIVLQMLRAKRGASIAQLANATGWQHHSVRGAISGIIKKKLRLKVSSDRVDGVRYYRIGK